MKSSSTDKKGWLPHPTRRFIDVPFREKEKAKALGAKFCFEFRMWYVPKGLDRTKFVWADVLMPKFMRDCRFPEDRSVKRAATRPKVPRTPDEKADAALLRRFDEESRLRLRYLIDKCD